MTKEEVLQNCTVECFVVKLPNIQLDRKLYLEVAKSLELIGGKWKGGKVFGFTFSGDPTELLSQISNGEKRNLKKEFQFFGTPEEIADKLVEFAEIKKDDIILEPSAGQGAIIDSIRKKFKKNFLFYCEKMDINLKILYKKYSELENVYQLHPLNDDFLEMDEKFIDFPGDTGKMLYHKIIANPPFSKNQDIDHIHKMYDCLKDGGRIVTIASTHWKTSCFQKEINFRNWLKEVGAKIEKIPAGTFKESGTMVESCIIIIDKK